MEKTENTCNMKEKTQMQEWKTPSLWFHLLEKTLDAMWYGAEDRKKLFAVTYKLQQSQLKFACNL